MTKTLEVSLGLTVHLDVWCFQGLFVKLLISNQEISLLELWLQHAPA